jgi:hypothetical protein
MLRERREPHFADFSWIAIERSRVIHDPVVAFVFEM